MNGPLALFLQSAASALTISVPDELEFQSEKVGSNLTKSTLTRLRINISLEESILPAMPSSSCEKRSCGATHGLFIMLDLVSHKSVGRFEDAM